MADRTVKVNLEADVAEFVAGMDDAHHATEKLATGVDTLDRDVKKLPKAAEQAAMGMEELIATLAETAHEADKAGDQLSQLEHKLAELPPGAAAASAGLKLISGDMREVSTSMKTFGEKQAALEIMKYKITDLQGEIRMLSQEFIETGKADPFNQLVHKSGELQLFKGSAKNLEKEIKDGLEMGAEEAPSVFGQVFASIGDIGGSELKAGLIGGLIAAVVAFSPIIISGLGGAVAAALGLVGIGGGIALAIRNPEVKAAFGTLGHSLMAELSKAFVPFQSQLITVSKTLGATFASIAPQLDQIGSHLATALAPLAGGLGGLVTAMMPGLAKAFDGLLPVLDRFDADLPVLGEQLGKFFDEMTASPEAAASGLDVVLSILGGIIQYLGMTIALFEHLYDQMRGLSDAMADFSMGDFKDIPHDLEIAKNGFTMTANGADDLKMSLAGVGSGMGMLGQNLSGMIHDLATAEGATDKLKEALDAAAQTADVKFGAAVQTMFDGLMGIDRAELQTYQSTADLTDAIKKNGHSLDEHTASGRANAGALLDAVQANMQLYQAMVAAGGSSHDAANQYLDNEKALKQQAIAAGLSSSAVDQLIGSYDSVPAIVSTAIQMKGLAEAINKLGDVISMLSGLAGGVTYHSIILKYEARGLTDAQAQATAHKFHGGIERRAATGLIVPPSNPGTILFGEPETGGEAFIPLRGISRMRAMDLAQQVGNAYSFNVNSGGGAQTVVVQPHFTISAGGGAEALGGMLQELQRKGYFTVTQN